MNMQFKVNDKIMHVNIMLLLLNNKAKSNFGKRAENKINMAVENRILKEEIPAVVVFQQLG